MPAGRKRICASLSLLVAAAFLPVAPSSAEAGPRKKVETHSATRKKAARKPLEVNISPRKRRGHDDSFLGKAPRTPFVAFRRDGSVLDWRGSLPTVGLPEQRIATVGTATYKGKESPTIIGSPTGKLTAVGNTTIVADFTPGGGTITGTVTITVADDTSQPTGNLTPGTPSIDGSLSSFKFSGAATTTGGSSGGQYQGAFYGGDAAGIAGTFHVGSAGSSPVMGVPTLESVGAFGGNK